MAYFCSAALECAEDRRQNAPAFNFVIFPAAMTRAFDFANKTLLFYVIRYACGSTDGVPSEEVGRGYNDIQMSHDKYRSTTI